MIKLNNKTLNLLLIITVIAVIVESFLLFKWNYNNFRLAEDEGFVEHIDSTESNIDAIEAITLKIDESNKKLANLMYRNKKDLDSLTNLVNSFNSQSFDEAIKEADQLNYLIEEYQKYE